MIRWISCIVLFMFCMTGQVWSQTVLYVTADGTGPGTISNPAGLQAALDSAGHDQDDAVIRVARGTYYGNFECEVDTLLSRGRGMWRI